MSPAARQGDKAAFSCFCRLGRQTEGVTRWNENCMSFAPVWTSEPSRGCAIYCKGYDFVTNCPIYLTHIRKL